LSWEVTSEINVSHYEIERRGESNAEFHTIDKTLSQDLGTGDVYYNYQDYNIGSDEFYYYRIKQIDLDGNFTYSETIAITVEHSRFKKAVAKVYPNPSIGQFELELDIYESGILVNYTIFDSAGKMVVSPTQLTESVDFGKHIFFMQELQLVPGVYNMKLNVGKTEIQKKLIIVSN